MNESEYRAAVAAEREFGKIQVHQQFRGLAVEMGLPPECTLATAKPIPYRPRWMVHQDHQQHHRDRVQLMAEERVAWTFPRPDSFVSPAEFLRSIGASA